MFSSSYLLFQFPFLLLDALFLPFPSPSFPIDAPHPLPPQVISQPCYGGVNLFMNYLQKIGVEVTWVKENNIEQYKQAVKGNTKVMCT